MKHFRAIYINFLVLIGIVTTLSILSEIGLRAGIRCVKSCEEAMQRVQNQKVAEKSSYRVMLLGDSLAAPVTGYGDMFCDQLQSEYKGVDCLNNAAGGHGPIHYLQNFRKRVASYRPNLIILNYSVGNDLSDSFRVSESDLKVPATPWYEHSHLFQYLKAKKESRDYWNSVRKSEKDAEQIKGVKPLNPVLATLAKEFPKYLEENLLMP